MTVQEGKNMNNQQNGMPAKLVPIQPPPGEYAALGCGNKVQWVCNGHTFTVETEDYVKGIDCPCTVTVTDDHTYWVDYSRRGKQ